MAQGPEDSLEWRRAAGDSTENVVTQCARCKSKISFYHCADTGCPWCSMCGLEAREKKETPDGA